MAEYRVGVSGAGEYPIIVDDEVIIAHCYLRSNAERIARALTLLDRWERSPEQELRDAYRALTEPAPSPDTETP